MRAVRDWMTALESGWRAGLKQYRKRKTELRNVRMADQYQRDAIVAAQTNNEVAEDLG